MTRTKRSRYHQLRGNGWQNLFQPLSKMRANLSTRKISFSNPIVIRRQRIEMHSTHSWTVLRTCHRHPKRGTHTTRGWWTGHYRKPLSEIKGQKYKLIIPERGKKITLLELSQSNAQSYARQSQIKWQGHENQAVRSPKLSETFGCKKHPRLE